VQIINIEQNTPEWLEYRLGKISGSKLKDIITIRGTEKKVGFYQLAADRLALIEETDEQARDRGHRLEEEAIEELNKKLNKNFVSDVGIWISDKNPDLIVSPDGGLEDKGKYTKAAEVKCLKAALHIKAFEEQKIPSKYNFQVLQYFIVNEDLEELYFCLYDPRIKSKPFHYLLVTRQELQPEIDKWFEYELNVVKEINEIVERWAF
jgi:predicted phage-related endonuclease